jgi:hypothetical protein
MTIVCKNGEIVATRDIPEVAFDRVKEFAKDTGYKGDLELPIGPYDDSRYNHVAQSLRLLRILGAVEEIAQIKIGTSDLHLVLRNGKSLTLMTGTLNWDSNLEKIAKSSRREIR